MENNFQNFVAVFAMFLIIGVFCVFSSIENVESSVSDNVSGWAWSDNIGWICFNSVTDGSANDYGVNIKDDGEFEGYAWSDNVGWISFNPAELVGCPAGTCEAKLDKDTGEVSGWARVLSSDGWIRLRDESNGFANDDVYIDISAGDFHNYAWSDDIGWISFNCETGGPGGTDVCATFDYKVTTSFSFNQAPTINSVSHSPNIKKSGSGELVNFSSDAFDPDAGDKIKLYVCEDSNCANCEPGNTSGCLQGANGAVVSGIAAATDPSAQYETGVCEHIEKNYFAKVCDLSDECSAGTASGVNPLIIRKDNGCACGCSNGPCDECYGDNGSNGCCCSNLCQVCPCGDPKAENLDFESVNINYCLPGSAGYIGLKWIYSNSVGIREQQFHIQVSTNSSFTALVVNKEEPTPGLLPGSNNASGLNVVIAPSGDYDISYNDTYYWRVKVQDEYNIWSDWAYYNGNSSFPTPLHPYPNPDFTMDPTNPGVGEEIQLCTTNIAPCLARVSVCYSGGSEIACHTGGKDFEWIIPEIPANGSYTDGDAASYNPKIQFDAFVNTSINLEITDTGITAGSGNCASGAVGCCAISKNVSAAGLPLPEWWEISPSF